jgi:hypothetical protein
MIEGSYDGSTLARGASGWYMDHDGREGEFMSPEFLQALGTYVSVLAVVISVINLTTQVRRQTRSVQSQNYGRALDRLASVQSRLGTDPAAANIFNRGVRDPGLLTSDERTQFTWILYEIFGAFEFMFDEAQGGRLPPHVWTRWSDTLAWWISLPGVQAWWRAAPTPFNERFSAFVEERIGKPAFDVERAQRWRQFLSA